MARVKRSVNAHKKRREILDQASGYRGQRSRLYRKAKEQVLHSSVYAYRDRRARKGDFRKLWIARINAAARAEGMTYNRFISGLKTAGCRGRPQDPRRSGRDRSDRVRRSGRDRQGQPGRPRPPRPRRPDRTRQPAVRRGLSPPSEPIAPPSASAGALRSARGCSAARTGRRRGQFLAEGRQAVSEAFSTTYVRRLLVDEAVGRAAPGSAERCRRGRRTAAQRVATGRSPTSPIPSRRRASWRCAMRSTCRWRMRCAGHARLVVLCDQVRDPGNLGTVIRCADAFGADAVLVSTDSVDLYNPKTVRASTGSLFHLPISVEVDLRRPSRRLARVGLATYGADGARTARWTTWSTSGELARPTCGCFGNEAWGLSAEHAALLDRPRRAPDVRPRREPQPLHRRRRPACTRPPPPSADLNCLRSASLAPRSAALPGHLVRRVR